MDLRPLTVLIVSQWSILTAGLERAIVAAWPDAAIVAVDGALGALSAAAATRFDLAVVQQDLAGVSGAVTTHLIRTVSPETVSVLLVEQITDVVTVTAIGHGVSAIVPTASTGPGLVGLARQALAGARPLDTVIIERPDLAATMFDDVRSAALDEAVHPIGLRAWPPVAWRRRSGERSAWTVTSFFCSATERTRLRKNVFPDPYSPMTNRAADPSSPIRSISLSSALSSLTRPTWMCCCPARGTTPARSEFTIASRSRGRIRSGAPVLLEGVVVIGGVPVARSR